MNEQPAILVESNRGLARVMLNRPHRRNALDARMVAALCETFEGLGRDSSMRAIVLTGAGTVFCAGADINWMAGAGTVSAIEAQVDAERLMRMFRSIDECPCPVIGRVQGPVFGGGLGLVAACDVVVTAEDVTFALSEVRLGLIPALISPFLLRKAGDSFVRRYGLTGESFSPQVARHFNLVHDVVDRAGLDARTTELVEAVMRLAPQAVRQTKALFRRIQSPPHTELWAVCSHANAQARLSEEAAEGLRAFLAKRSPSWVQERGDIQVQEVTPRHARD